jgi:predicted  nucleic acid-binding Zn ribbon protein
MYTLSNNPFHCGRCNLEVQLDTLVLANDYVEQVVRWRTLYAACYHLWLDSGEYEDWASEQLFAIDSPVNQLGVISCTTWKDKGQIYYWYDQSQKSTVTGAMEYCPRCGNLFSNYTEGVFPQRLCERCHIITPIYE